MATGRLARAAARIGSCTASHRYGRPLLPPAEPPGAEDVADLLAEMHLLRADPFASDVDWLGWFERRAALFTRIAVELHCPEWHALAEQARDEVTARREALDLDPRDLDELDLADRAADREDLDEPVGGWSA